MTFENIKLDKTAFALQDGYFYYFNHTNDMLYQKNASGAITFTFPLFTSLNGKEVLSLETDGHNFWTLQEITSLSRVIRQWRIQDFFCVLINTWYFNDSDNYYGVTSLALEYYKSSLKYDVVNGATTITLSSELPKLEEGSIITIGPNNEGHYEEVTVTGTVSGTTVGLDFFVQYDYPENTDISYVSDFWLFNAYTKKVSSPSLNRYNLLSKSIEDTLIDTEYSNVVASTFCKYGDQYNLLYVKNTALKFFDVNELMVIKTMTMDNLRADQTSTAQIFDIVVEDDTLYRLQNYVTYYGVSSAQYSYNYQCSTLRSFVDSISLGVTPKILPSDGRSIAEIQAIVQDQFGDPAQYKVVYLYDNDDEYGYITIPNAQTDLEGKALSYYRAGVSPKSVIITAIVTQYD